PNSGWCRATASTRSTRRSSSSRACGRTRWDYPTSPRVPEMSAIDVDLAQYRAELEGWLDANLDALAPPHDSPGTLDDHAAQRQRVKALCYDAGWMQHGWPEGVGGRGGSPMLRTELGAALARRALIDSGLFSLIEVLAPTVIDYAPPELAAEMVPRLL